MVYVRGLDFRNYLILFLEHMEDTTLISWITGFSNVIVNYGEIISMLEVGRTPLLVVDGPLNSILSKRYFILKTTKLSC